MVWSDGVEDCNAIDPGVFRDPTNETLWLTYGSLFRLHPPGASSIRRPAAAPSSAPAGQRRDQFRGVDLIFRDGWYYCCVTHGPAAPAPTPATTSAWAGRGRSPGRSAAWASTCSGAAASCFAGSTGRHIGPGHFGLLDLGAGVEKFSCTTKPISIAAASASWTSGRCSGATGGPWPATIHGRHLPDRIGAHRDVLKSGGAGRACRWPTPARPGRGSGLPQRGNRHRRPIAAQDPAQVSGTWPAGPVSVRMETAHGPGTAEVVDRAAQTPRISQARRSSRSRLPARTACWLPRGRRADGPSRLHRGTGAALAPRSARLTAPIG